MAGDVEDLDYCCFIFVSIKKNWEFHIFDYIDYITLSFRGGRLQPPANMVLNGQSHFLDSVYIPYLLGFGHTHECATRIADVL